MSKKVAGLLLTLFITAVFAYFGGKWVKFRLEHSITNAVFVESDSFVQVSFRRVAGEIRELYVKEGERVEKGQVLARLEDADYRRKLRELENEIQRLAYQKEALEIKRRALERELRERVALLKIRKKQAREKVSALDLQIEKLAKDWRRFKALKDRGTIPPQKFEEIDTRLKALRKERKASYLDLLAVDRELKILKVKLEGLGEIDSSIKALQSQIKALEVRREDLLSMIEETALRSPVSGYVVKRYVDVGENVRQGQYVYAIYDPDSLYILALLEETKLRGVKEGSRVIIEIDAYPDLEYEGVVKEIGRSTASKFAIIPRDITAGEFTKVAQRIPVKIEITKGDLSLLRVGMSGEVAIKKEF